MSGARRKKKKKLTASLADDAHRIDDERQSDQHEEDDAERDLWRQSVMETALSQILSDDAIQERTKEAFRRTALDGEPPESVAASLGVTRNAVDQMKSRVMAKLKKLAGDLEAAALPEPRDGH